MHVGFNQYKPDIAVGEAASGSGNKLDTQRKKHRAFLPGA
jgi:hypothetical protein